MKIIKKCLIISLVLWGNLSVNAYCCTLWDVFLQQPDKDALMVLENTIIAESQHCRPEVVPAQMHRTQLFELISEGNQFAFCAALLVSRCWDGGESEDFDRSAGVFFEKQPRTFLQIAKGKAIPDSQLRYLFTMLPLGTVDNIDSQISVVENRIAILKGFSEEPFSEIKNIGLFFLEKEKEDLNRIKLELK